ncbi:MAG: ABC transporter ATP-binding protein [Methylacidiphilales bacterium]|nr:ABC transporter ATP-binding protein [Candidatus Methylacidiphilales bacterium]
MTSPIIQVRGLSKRYNLGSIGVTTLRDEVERFLDKCSSFLVPRSLLTTNQEPRTKNSEASFWALRDVSFDVQPGEVLGIIGKNGAGKSTLLKILSRITEPSSGEAILRGRVASLLEVGTGFHPDLSGRENIYLNGAILGMKKREMDKKLDEIVAFSEVEKFIDTPVKHYSSGMYVRLAFAVAAHLESEILIVDEVLAVGDSAFQKKCLGKMGELARGHGRTVLFVSHNITVMLQICSRLALMNNGQIENLGEPHSVANRYLAAKTKASKIIDLDKLERVSEFSGAVKYISAELCESLCAQPWQLSFGAIISLKLTMKAKEQIRGMELGLSLKTLEGTEIISTLSSWNTSFGNIDPGVFAVVVSFPKLNLTPGIYHIGLGVRRDRGLEDYLPEALEIEILETGTERHSGMNTIHGIIAQQSKFELL